MATELEEVKLQVAQANRVLSDVGLATGVTSALGHASLRVPSQPDRFVVKGRQYALDALAVMRAEDMVVCDTEGFLVEAPLALIVPHAWLAMTSVPGKSNLL
jgi:ribulose-5-phosphate 4-epimerase/fuculose-1-phosphate aldolase